MSITHMRLMRLVLARVLMLVFAMAAVATLALITFAQAAQAQEPAGVSAAARQQFQAGVAGFKQGAYEVAAAHFQQAIEMAPQYMPAHLYLGTTYAQLYIPGANTPDNLRNGEAAIREFKIVAAADDARREYRLQAMKGIASLYLNMKRFDDAVAAYQRVIDTDPSDAEPYYSIGVLRWSEAYRQRMDLRAKLDLQPMDSLPPGPECVELRAKVESGVEDGIQRMKKALELRPDYDDAMAYMNLLYRERADYECDNPQARAADLKTADEWVDLTMATKKRKEQGTLRERPSTGTGGSGGGSGGGTSDPRPRVPKTAP